MRAQESVFIMSLMKIVMRYSGFAVWWYCDGPDYEMGPVVP